jgi:hypothetical protein
MFFEFFENLLLANFHSPLAKESFETMQQIFGDFIEEKHDDTEYLVLGFSPGSLPLKERWRANGLSADFIADYLQIFFIGEQKNNHQLNVPIPVQSKNAVKYIANELLENAMKFSDETSNDVTRFAFHLYSNKLIFYVTNSIKPENVEMFQDFIKEIMQKYPSELYFRRMESNANDENSNSGLGLLSMICDYSAKISWKFETVTTEPSITIVTTMVSLEI